MWGIKRNTDEDLEGFFYEIWWSDEIINDINATISSLLQPGRVMPAFSNEVNPYITDSVISCGSSCSRNIYCIGSADTCVSSCSITCSTGCYNISCINTSQLYCANYSSTTYTCSQCMSTFIYDVSVCTCENTKALATAISIPKCVNKIPNCISYDYFSGKCTECALTYYVLCSSSIRHGNSCITSCGSNYYIDTDPARCIPCGTDCATCISDSNCTLCTNGKYLKSGSCVTYCDVGYLQNSTTMTCIQCSKNCAVCIYVSTNLVCTSCSDDYLKGGECVSDCGAGYYRNSSAKTCDSCLTSCTACTSSTICTACETNYMLKPSSTTTICAETFDASAAMTSNGIFTLTFTDVLSQPLSANLLRLSDGSLQYDSTSFTLAQVANSNDYTITINKIYLPYNALKLNFPTGNQVITSSDKVLGTSNLPISIDPTIFSPSCSYTAHCNSCTLADNVYKCDSCISPYYFNSVTLACETWSTYMHAVASMDTNRKITLIFDKTLKSTLLTDYISFSIQDYTYTSLSMTETEPLKAYTFFLNGINLGDSSEVTLNFVNSSSITASDNSPLQESYITITIPPELRCTSNCQICHTESSISICDECKTGFLLKNDVPGYSCVSSCPLNYYINTSLSPNICEKCPDSCTQCSESGCSACVYGYYLLDISCETECPKGYYKDTLNMKCSSCKDENCIACDYKEETGSVVCRECGNETVLVNIGGYAGCMKCYSNTYYNGSECSDCPKLCSRCDDKSCIECVENAELSPGICRCMTDYMESDGKCVSFVIARIEVVGNGKIRLTFNKPLKNELRAEFLGIKINGVVYNSDHFILEKEGDSNQAYIITLRDIDTSTTTSLTLEFIDKDNTMGTDNSFLSSESISVPLNNNSETNTSQDQGDSDQIDEVSPSSTYSQADYLASDPAAEEVASQGSTATSSVTTISAAMSFSSTAGLWNLVNTIQLISVIPLLNVELPIMLFATLSSLRSYNPLPNIMTYMMPQTGPRPFRRASLLGFETGQFFINIGDVVLTFFITIGVLPLLLILKRLLPGRFRGKFIDKKVTQMIQDYKWNVFIRFYIESYIELAIAGSLQLITIKDISDYNQINTYINIITAFITITSVIIFPLLLAVFIYKNHTKVKNDEFMKRWGSIFDEFDTSRGLYSVTFYYVHFLSRRLAVVACFFLFKDMPVTQMIIASVFCWIKFYIVARYRPFKERSTNVINILIELSIASCYTLVILFAYDIGETTREIVQWAVIGFVMLGFATNISSILYNTISLVIQKIRKDKAHMKVDIVPEVEEERYTFNYLEASMTQLTMLKEENSFYSKLSKRKSEGNQIK